MRCANYYDARHAAELNASTFSVPFIVFTDTSGNWHCERYDPTLSCHRGPSITIIHPPLKEPPHGR